MRDFPGKSGPADAEESRDLQARPLARFLSTSLRFLGTRIGLLVLSAAILTFVVYLITSRDSFKKSGELEQEIQRLQHEISVLEDENRLLRQKKDRLETDPAYIEDEARKKLGLVRPGEVVYRLSEEPELSDDPPSDLPSSLQP